MKLLGSWYISLCDETKTGTYEATEVELIDGGRWLRFVAAGKVYVTSYPATLRANLPAKSGDW
jgi:hypothetical protein